MRTQIPFYSYNIDISGQCNLRCPSCPNGNHPPHEKPRGFMSLDLYKKIIDKIYNESPGQTTELRLYNWGEPFLHPELPTLIALAREKNLAPQISTNGMIEKNIKEVIQANPHSIRISLSGIFQDSYSRTHYPGEIETLKRNSQLIRRCIDKHRQELPVHYYYHKYRHNQAEEMIEARQFAEKLGFTFKAVWATYGPLEKMIKNLAGDISPKDRDLMSWLCLSPFESRDIALTLREKYPDCPLRMNETSIDYDGSVANCCAAYDRENYLGDNFLEIDHETIQTKKYNSQLCKVCMQNGIDITYCYGVAGEFDAWIAEKRRANKA